MNLTNQYRASRALAALKAWAKANKSKLDDPVSRSDVVDLLVDLLHLCSTNSIEVSEMWQAAEGIFDAEHKGENCWVDHEVFIEEALKTLLALSDLEGRDFIEETKGEITYRCVEFMDKCAKPLDGLDYRECGRLFAGVISGDRERLFSSGLTGPDLALYEVALSFGCVSLEVNDGGDVYGTWHPPVVNGGKHAYT